MLVLIVIDSPVPLDVAAAPLASPEELLSAFYVESALGTYLKFTAPSIGTANLAPIPI